MIPTREAAENLIMDAEKCNPGPWGDHCRVAALCAERIARECGNLDSEKAYVLGLLHDIGRKFGIKHLGHVYDGYWYMTNLGYDEVARICLTHSFCNHILEAYIGNHDIEPEQEQMLKDILKNLEYDDYDRLIQLCDALALPSGPTDIIIRMEDVKSRYGFYPIDKWIMNLGLKAYFESKMHKNIYTVINTEDAEK